MTEEPFDAADPAYRPGVDVRVQVKMQRSELGAPLLAGRLLRGRHGWPATHYVVEMQRTRTGQRSGEKTRPYRFGEFDILAVSLGPATGRWANFMYTVERWLLPASSNPSFVLTYQPVPPEENDAWTADFETCVGWWRSGEERRIA